MRTIGLLLVALGFCAPPATMAQDVWVDRFEVWGGIGGWARGPGDELPRGMRAGFALHKDADDGPTLGIEALTGRYRPEGARRAVTEYGLSVSARWRMAAADAAHPYLQGRLGWHRRSGSGSRSDTHQDALAFGPEAGWIVPVSDVVRVLVGLDVAALWYADAQADSRPVPDTGGLGLRWGLRFGLNLGTPFDAGGGSGRRGPG